MIFNEQTYSVLIVSSTEKFSSALTPLLSPAQFWPIKKVTLAGEARRAALDRSYDIVIVNTPLSDEFGTTLASDICVRGNSAVLIFVKNDIYDDVYSKVSGNGVSVMAKPASTQLLPQVLNMLCSFRERIRSMESRQSSVEDSIKEIRLINKAKWLLIDHLNMTEADAHHYIEKSAMDQRLSKTEIANSIIRTYRGNGQ